VLSLGGVGAEIMPSTAERILCGIETLPLRMQRHSDNARAVAAWLCGHESVRWVSYAGLPGDRYHNLSRQYQPNGAGPSISFALKDEAAAPLTSRLKLISPAAVAGGTRSSIRRVGAGAEGRAGAVAVLRLCVGIEDRDDIVADLEQALAGA
jgi:O-acetylhomoserine (thiol)-lyase